MIIQRLSEAIRTQNWFTVLIELLILVMGVFLGLQANNWNEYRLDRIREGQNLERLLNEAEAIIVHIQDDVAFGESIIEAQRAMFEFLSSDDSAPANAEQVEWGFDSLAFLPSLSPPRTAYNELTASGGIQLIQSLEVREATATYYARLDWFQGQLAYFRQGFGVAESDPFLLARDHIKSRYDPSAERGRKREYDWTGIRALPHLETLLVNMFRDQIVINANRGWVLANAREMCEAIADELGRECNQVSDKAE